MLLGATLVGGCAGDGADDAAAGPGTAATVQPRGSVAPGRGATPPPAPTCAIESGDRSLDVEGTSRSYHLVVPEGLAAPAPVVVLFHGFASSPELVLAATGLGDAGPAGGVIVAAPRGIGDPPTWRPLADVDLDAAFVDAVLTELGADPCVDDGRIWLAGHSAGAAFAGVYGCTHVDEVRGVALNAGLPPPLCPEGAGVEVVITHGTADPVVPFGGGDQAVGEGTVALADVPTSAAGWAERAGCDPTPSTRPAADAEVSTWTGCVGGVTVSLAAVDGGGHVWPGPEGVALDPATQPAYPATCVLLAHVTGRDPFGCDGTPDGQTP